MIIAMHRVNTIEDLKKTPVGLGVETDLRSDGKDIILHHEPFFGNGEKLEDFISRYSHEFIILDIKSEGIERRAIDIVENAGIKDYYLLNVNFPFIMKLAKTGFRKMSVRFSDFESADACLAMKNKADFVWVESFSKLALTKEVCKKLSRHFRLSLVSPELYGRNEIEIYKKKLKGMDIHSVCTDYPDKWR
ncbi:MAG: hypothetical protein HYW26_01970 [Candidatus Aenigmarchaeota archaeon]|nr:hypothetical protein [Candidatus Aenigmarchaeota archaeon]